MASDIAATDTFQNVNREFMALLLSHNSTSLPVILNVLLSFYQPADLLFTNFYLNYEHLSKYEISNIPSVKAEFFEHSQIQFPSCFSERKKKKTTLY